MKVESNMFCRKACRPYGSMANSSMQREPAWACVPSRGGRLVRFWGLRFGLPHTNTRPDETIVIDVALSVSEGQFPTRRFYDYPWLFMWLMAGLYCFTTRWAASRVRFSRSRDSGELAVQWMPFFLIPRACRR